MAASTKRYQGIRWRIAYGSYGGAEKFAVNELHAAVQGLVPYVMETVEAARTCATDDVNFILVGTTGDNPLIADLAARGALALPRHQQGYAIAGVESPWMAKRRVIAVAATAPGGVLHGVESFVGQVLAPTAGAAGPAGAASLESVTDMSLGESPAIETRGIWTWGYVIYDYRRLFDHMARLRMNSIIIWNDCPPLNCREVIEYARSRGIAVIMGFHWGWGTALDIADADDRLAIQREVLAKYRADYEGLGADGIYFQTQTEHYETKRKGRTTAYWACRLANEVCEPLLEAAPELRVYFGLHATSILGNYGDLAELDPRVTVVWEDAGAIPFSYDPVAELTPASAEDARPRTVEETLEYAKRLASLRPGDEFAMVPKGWTTLDWTNEFEHHGAFILGERSREFIRTRLAGRQGRWDYVNDLWARNYPLAAAFYRGMLEATGGRLAAWGLVEDSLLEEGIQPSVALFAETLWDPRRDDEDILRRAMRACGGRA